MRRALFAAAVMAAGLVAAAPPAWAHGGATNDQAKLGSVQPEVKGLEVELLDRSRIEIKNKTGKRVIVFGYAGEPYLRLEKRAVYTNERSPATYLNRSMNGGDVPESVDASAPPQWKRLAVKKDGVRWHDHRLHRFASIQTSDSWKIGLSVGDTPVVLSGAISRDEPPRQWPWWLFGAIGGAGLVAAAQHYGRKQTLLGGLAVTFLCAQVVAMGAGGLLPGLAALAAIPAAAAVWFLRQPLAAGLAGALGLGAGLASVSDLAYAHMGVAMGDGLYRGAVVLCVGVGLGLVWLAALATVRPDPTN